MKKGNNIVIIDHMSFKTFHIVFNSSFLKICSLCFDKVIYKANWNYIIRNIQLNSNLKNCNNIELKKRYIYKGDNKIGWIIRNLMGLITNIWEYLTIKPKSTICYNPTDPLSFPVLLLINIFLQRNIIFVVHGDLTTLKKNFKPNKPSFYYKICYQLGFKYLIRYSNAKVLVLGKSIKNNLSKIIPESHDNIITIFHPAFVDDSILQTRDSDYKDRPLIIGTAGTMNKNKGLDKLLHLSYLFSEDINKGKIELRCIGKVDDPTAKDNKLINWIGYEDILSKESFESEIKKLDYLLYLYDPTEYELTASGAIIDSIIYGIPFIAIKNNFFEDLFKDAEFGYFVDSLEEVVRIINCILKQECKQNFENQFVIMKNRVSIKNNSILLKDQLNL